MAVAAAAPTQGRFKSFVQSFNSRFKARGKEIWRSTHITVKALPIIALAGLAFFTAPV